MYGFFRIELCTITSILIQLAYHIIYLRILVTRIYLIQGCSHNGGYMRGFTISEAMSLEMASKTK